MKKEGILSFIKFCTVGAINTIVSLCIYYLLLNLGTNYLISITIGYIISSICGYFLSKVWVFKKKEDKITNSIFKYYILYGSALILNLLCMFILVKVLGFSDKIAPLITLVITTIYNYLFSKFWVFNSKKTTSIDFQTIKKDKGFLILFTLFTFFVNILFINNLYNHPVADDYSNYNKIITEIGDNEHTTINTTMAISKLAVHTYKTWQGTYFANILFFMNPLLISQNAYKITMFLIQVFWLFGLLFFFQSLPSKNQSAKIRNLKLYFIFSIFSILSMYSLGEGVYWFTGSILYIIPFTISMIFFGLLLRYFKNPKTKHNIFLILLAIVLGGTSYVTGLIVGAIILLLTIYSYLKKRNRLFLSALLIIFSIGFAFNVFCPGNFMRIDSFEKASLLQVIYFSVFNALDMIKHLIFETLFIPILLISFPLIISLAKNININFKKPIISILVCLFCFIATFVPMAYSYGSNYQETRVKNIQLFYLAIMFIICIIIYTNAKLDNKSIKTIGSYHLPILGIISAIVMVPAIGLENIAGFALINDYLYMRNSDYNKCINQLDTYISESTDNPVVITNCKIYPSSLHYYKIQNGTWQTEALKKYFNKEIVVDNGDEQ